MSAPSFATKNQSQPKVDQPSAGSALSQRSAERPPSKLLTEYYASMFFLLVACVVAISFFVLRPRMQRVKELNAQTTSQLRVVENERSYLGSIEQSLAATRVIASGTLDAISQALPYTTDIPSLVQQFGSASEDQGVHIDTLQFREQPRTQGNEKDANRVLPIDINLSIRARSYGDMKQFLTRLEQSLRLMDVLGIAASGGDTAEVAYQLQLRTYIFSPPSKRSESGGAAS